MSIHTGYTGYTGFVALPFPVIFLRFFFHYLFSLCPISPRGRRKRQLSFIRMAFPIEHLQRSERATSMAGIIKVSKKVWRAVTPECLKNLYESMPRCIAAMIAAGGHHTNYQSASELSNCIILINKWTFPQGGAIFFRKIVHIKQNEVNVKRFMYRLTCIIR